jgi:hypothetical protein
MKNEEIKNRWREHFDKLFNDESEKTTIRIRSRTPMRRRSRSRTLKKNLDTIFLNTM